MVVSDDYLFVIIASFLIIFIIFVVTYLCLVDKGLESCHTAVASPQIPVMASPSTYKTQLITFLINL